MVNTMLGFTQTANVAYGFSDLVILFYDHELEMHARSSIGLQVPPLNLAVVTVIYALLEMAVSV